MTAESDTSINGAGLKIAVQDYGGQGLPILLLHGAGCSLAHWLLMAPLLAKQHRVVAMDFRGHGLSEAGPWSIEALMGDMEAVCRHYAFSDVALVGHSMGGVLATLYAARHPNIASVVNLDGFGLTPSEYADLDPADVVERQRRLRAEDESSSIDIEARISSYRKEITLNAAQAEGIARREHRQSLNIGLNEKEWIQIFSGIHWLFYEYLAKQSFFELLNATSNRTLIFKAGRRPTLLDQALWKQDLFAVFFAGINRELARLHDSRKIRVETIDATHGMLLEIPEKLAARINDFLQERE